MSEKCVVGAGNAPIHSSTCVEINKNFESIFKTKLTIDGLNFTKKFKSKTTKSFLKLKIEEKFTTQFKQYW